MRRHVEAPDLLRDPIGGYVTGRTFVVWVDSATLAGAVYFGRPDERDFPELQLLTALPGHAAIAQGFDAVIDTSGVEMIDLPAYAFMVTHLDSVVALASKAGRVSVVRPAGMTGATVAGMFADGVQRRFRSALFTGPREAFAWLERTDALDVYAALETLLAGIRGTPPMLRELRELLAAKPRSTLTTVARALGVSERSLSRRLQELHTTFRAESQRACLRAAEAMLIRGDDKLETIARATGFTSRTHFTTFFQAATGETPSEFRARRRSV